MGLLFSQIEAECVSRSVAHIYADRPRTSWGEHMFNVLDLNDCSCMGDGVLRACKTLDLGKDKEKVEEQELINLEDSSLEEENLSQDYDAESEYSESDLDINESDMSHSSSDGPKPPRLDLDQTSLPKREKVRFSVPPPNAVEVVAPLVPEVMSREPIDMPMSKRPVVALPKQMMAKAIPEFAKVASHLAQVVPPYQGTKDIQQTAANTTISHLNGPPSKAPSSSKQVSSPLPNKGEKIYCTKYIYTGACSFTGHKGWGCSYKHIVPRPENLAELGLQELPQWVLENGGPDLAPQIMASKPPPPIPGTPEYEAARGPSKEKLQLEYCKKYLSTGQCDYMQEGCKLKHKIPSDEMLIDLGYLKKPSWMYREKQKDHTRVTRAASGENDIPSPGCDRRGLGHPARAPPPGAPKAPTAMRAAPTAASPAGPPMAPAVAAQPGSPPKRLSPEELKARFPNGKEYCTRWLKRNECEFWQTGCFFKHEAPPPDLAVALGFPPNGYPWWHVKVPPGWNPASGPPLARK